MPRKAASAATKPIEMSTAEAAVETMLGHGLRTVDELFDAFQRAGDRLSVVHARAHTPEELYTALRQSFAAREPTLIEVPVGAMPNPWEFIHMSRVRE